ncbi:hypothetical protein ABH903_003071 [Brevibacterium epidermidis]|jgi:hypothetical protein|uniref:Uncharacterized protein n=1 Tax=Brevibacterium epidermidis TaxID=1698 RepID=A0ABV4EN94_BREEP
MNNTTFEDPAKTDLVAACEVAIDIAGYQLVSKRIRVPLPGGLKGSLRGDLQSLDAQDNRTFYFVRPNPDDALPKWLANYARASRELRVGPMYVVVDRCSSAFEASCAAAGAGLLLINDENEFDVVLLWEDQDPSALEEALSVRLGELRREMERKLKLETEGVKQRHKNVSALVYDMPSDLGNGYLKKIEVEYKRVEDWGHYVSSRLDAVTAMSASHDVPDIEQLISAGPLLVEEE